MGDCATNLVDSSDAVHRLYEAHTHVNKVNLI